MGSRPDWDIIRFKDSLGNLIRRLASKWAGGYSSVGMYSALGTTFLLQGWKDWRKEGRKEKREGGRNEISYALHSKPQR